MGYTFRSGGGGQETTVVAYGAIKESYDLT